MAEHWKCGDEFLPFHPQASHVEPAYRDGWNACYRASIRAALNKGYVALSNDGRSVFIDGFGEVPLAYPAAGVKGTTPNPQNEPCNEACAELGMHPKYCPRTCGRTPANAGVVLDAVPDDDPARAGRGYVRMVPAHSVKTCWGLSSFCAEVGHKCRVVGTCLFTPPNVGVIPSADPSNGNDLDPRVALDYAERMKTYCESFDGRDWPMVMLLGTPDEQNLAHALDNLMECAAMLMNMASRVADASGVQEDGRG